jgi:hypothetical protein
MFAGLDVKRWEWTDADGRWSYTGPGRAWLAVKLTMWTLGLFPVSDTTQVSSINPKAAPLGAGDLDGLHTLYKNNPCPLIPD